MNVQVFRFGIDTARFNFDREFYSPEFESFFWGLSDNSNQKFGVPFLEYEFSLTADLQKHRESLYFDYAGDKVFCLTKILDGGVIRSISYIVTIYGSCFQIEALDHLLLRFLKKYLSHLKLSRLDLCLDTDIPVDAFWNDHKTRFHKKQRIEKSGKIETFYLGAKANNKKHFIRVYDKKTDSIKKGKFHLFFSYTQLPVVSRVEVEMHTITLKTMEVTPQTILEYEQARLSQFAFHDNPLASIFASLCINEKSTCFPQLEGVEIAKAKRIQTSMYTGRREDLEGLMTIPYVNAFRTRAGRLCEMGIDPILFLIHHRPRDPSDPFWEQVRTHACVCHLIYQLRSSPYAIGSFSPYALLPLRSEIYRGQDPTDTIDF